MTVGDLFSGIGGFSYGLELAGGFETKWFVENDPFCNKILAKHWPNVKRYGDIKDVGKANLEPVDLICGGFPCQPFSVAGKRKGKEDDRFLWPEMLRVISELRPRWVIGENVPGIVGVVLDQVLSEMESIGYEVQPLIIPACAVNAPHRRSRVWIIAHNGNIGRAEYGSDEGSGNKKSRERQTGWTGDKDSDVTDSASRETFSPEPRGFHTEPCRKDSDVADTNGQYRKEHQRGDKFRQERGQSTFGRSIYEPTWKESWPEVATRLCRVDDGVSIELHFIGGIESDQIFNTKSQSEKNFLIWKILRTMWEQRETAKTSPELYFNKLYDSLPQMPRQRRPEAWITKSESDNELFGLWQSFYSKGFSSAQDLQSKLLEYLRKIQRRKKMEKRNRVDRLKSLGNAVVPQVVEILGRMIMEVDKSL